MSTETVKEKILKAVKELPESSYEDVMEKSHPRSYLCRQKKGLNWQKSCSMYEIEIHRDAQTEINETSLYYEKRLEGLGQ